MAAEKVQSVVGSVNLVKSSSVSVSEGKVGGEGGGEAAPPSSLTQLVLVLFTEAVSGREEVPASLLVHLPHEGLLQGKERRRAHHTCWWRSLCCSTDLWSQGCPHFFGPWVTFLPRQNDLPTIKMLNISLIIYRLHFVFTIYIVSHNNMNLYGTIQLCKFLSITSLITYLWMEPAMWPPC